MCGEKGNGRRYTLRAACKVRQGTGSQTPDSPSAPADPPLLVEHGRNLPGSPRQWTVPKLFVLAGELIGDALERLCCRHLRIDSLACPMGCAALDVSGLPHMLTHSETDIGRTAGGTPRTATNRISTLASAGLWPPPTCCPRPAPAHNGAGPF